jgi:hypothetical protein
VSTIATLIDKIKGQFSGSISLVRRRLFGANNERLDFFMDSFYKLSPNQRTAVLGGVVAVIGLFVLGAVALYFAQVQKLRRDLNDSFAALHQLQGLKYSYEIESRNYDKLIETIERKTKQVSLKPFFEKTANDLGVTIEGLSDQKTALAAENPLAERVQEVKVDMRLPNISIPRLMNFLVEIEKSNKYLRVQDLQIRGRYGTKLYFDSQIKVRGYDVGG